MRGKIGILAGTAALLMLLPGVAAGVPDEANMNAGTIELDCAGTSITIWVNFVGSDRSGESPSLVVMGSDSRVFKVTSFSLGGEQYSLRFPAPNPPFELVECTHPSPWGLVTLEGAFIQ